MPSFARLVRPLFSFIHRDQPLASARRLVIALALTLCAATATQAATTYSWTGAASNLWSNQNNWNPVGVPANGDSVAFPAGAANLSNQNDLPVGTSLFAIAFNGSNYVVGGNGIVLTSMLSSGGSNNRVDLPIDVQANAVTISSVNQNSLTIAGNFDGTGPVSLAGGGYIAFAGSHTYSGTISTCAPSCTSGGFLRLNGASMPQAAFVDTVGFGLMGNGTIGAVNSRQVAPASTITFCCGTGNGSGTLNTGNLMLTNGISASFDINGAAAGSGYDQINVSGTVTLGSSTNLNLAMSPSFVPARNQVYTLINNDDSEPMTGAFVGKPEGTVLVLNGYQLLLSYVGGSGNDVTLTSLNGKEPSTTTISSSVNPSAPAQSVTLTATVTGSLSTPTGTVTFRDGTTTLGTATLSGGSATYTTSSLAIGSHSIAVDYPGDALYGGGTSTVLTQTVNKYATTTSISSDSNPSTFGNLVTFTAAVGSSGGTPTGTVTFSDGASAISGCTGAQMTDGQATCTTSALTVGDHSITAAYAGDGNNAISTSTAVMQVVNSAVTTTTTRLESSINPSNYGQPVVLSATVTGQSPTGTVEFADGDITIVGCASVQIANAQAQCTSNVLRVGTHSITANYAGDAGNRPSTSSIVSQIIAAGSGSKTPMITAGGDHSCVLNSDGGVKCWGFNGIGGLGTNTTDEGPTPVDVLGLNGGVSAIAAGAYFTCALTDSGGVKCWGDNVSGQLGDNSQVTRLAPVDVVGLSSGVVEIGAGYAHTCALTSAGGVKCWGENGNGQVGDNSQTQRHTPVDVVGLSSGVAAIAVGYYHSCALMDTGGVKCWGNNSNGQLGDGTTSRRLAPVDVLGLASGVNHLAGGNSHTCAQMLDSGMKCWGRNDSGQLGDNTQIQRTTPVDVVDLTSGVAAMAGGDAHTCAVTMTGVVKCWGLNGQGQVGDNTNVTRLVPTDVVGLNNPAGGIAAGSVHNCALLSNGGVKCWGWNAAGQLGDGTTNDRANASIFVVGLDVFDRPTLVSSINPSSFGQSVTLTAMVSSQTMTGTIGFNDGNNAIAGCFAVPITSAEATCATTALSTGNHSITAVYSGDANNLSSTSDALTQVVDPAAAPTTTAVASSANPSTLGQAVTFTASVTGSSPTGTVNFKEGATTIGACSAVNVSAAGLATCTTSALALGDHSITAVYSGDANNATSTSGILTQTVNAASALAGYWTGNGTADDSSGFANHGTLNGATFAIGMRGQAFQFDGASNVSINGAGSYQFGTGDFSVAFWVLFDDLANNDSGIVHKDNYPASGYRGWLFNICDFCAPSGVGMQVRNIANGLDNSARVPRSNFVTGRWYHFAGVRSGTSLKLYVDGVLMSSIVTPGVADVSNAGELDIGSLSSGSRQYFNGAVDELRLYNYALSDADMSSLVAIRNVARAYVANQADNTLSEFDTVSNTVIATIPVPGAPGVMAAHPDGRHLYIVMGSGSVAVMDTATNGVIANIPVGSGPGGIALNAAGTRAYVPSQFDHNVSVIDTANNAVVATVPIPTGFATHVAVHPNGSRIYVGDQSSTVYVIDANTNTVLTSVGVGAFIGQIAVHPSGAFIYTANINGNSVSVIDTATNSVVATIPVGPGCMYCGPAGVAVHPAGTFAYAAADGDSLLYVIRTSDNVVVATVPTGNFPINVSVHPDGSAVYVANYDDGTISVMTTPANVLTETLTVGTRPGGFAVVSGAPAANVGVTSSLDPSTYGQNVTFTATVSGNSPSGAVKFKDGAAVIAECAAVSLAAGQAICTTSTLAVGSHTISAVYSGDANNGGHASDAVLQTVGAAGTSTAVDSSLNPSTFGQSVTFTANVGGTSPSGTVAFNDGAAAIASCGSIDVAGGQAICATSALSGGSHSITAAYSGDSNNAPSTSAAVVQVVNPAATSTSVTSASGTATAGQSVTFTATVTGSSPGGSIAFADGATMIAGCGAVALSGGGASCVTNALTVGGHSITAVYSGDGNNATSTSSAFSITIVPADGMPPTVQSLVRAATSPTMEDSVTYTLIFSEAVTGVSSSNFDVVTNGISAAAVGTISGSGTTWTVTVDTGRGTGSLHLDLVDGNGIVDGADNALAGAPIAGESYAIDKGGTVVGNGSGQPAASFGAGGYALFNDVQVAPAPGAVAVLADGRILAAGGIGCALPADGVPDACTLQLARYTPSGVPDPTFGTNGRLLTSITGIEAELSALIINGDGSFFVNGSRNNGSADVPFVSKYTSDGAPVASYATNGFVSLDSLPMGHGITGSAVDASGRVVVVGTTLNAGLEGNDIFVARLTTSGALDTTFGSSGVARIALSTTGSRDDRGTTVAVQPDGKIVAGGRTTGASGLGFDFMLLRLNGDGTLDTSFGSAGVATTRLTGSTGDNLGRKLALLPDGKIVLVGSVAVDASGDNQCGIVRFDAGGSPDATFGSAGQLLVPLSVGCFNVTLQSDGKVVVTGGDVTGDVLFATFVTILSTGQLDANFGTAGILDISSADGPTRVAVTSSGNLVTGLVVQDPADGIWKVYVVELASQLAQTTNTAISGISPEPSVVGQPYAVTVNVSAASGVPAGSVTVSDGSGASCAIAALSAGTGTCSMTSTSVGSRTITATYVGSSGFAFSAGTRAHTVNKASTATAVTSGANPAETGMPVTFTATVAVTLPGAGVPTGNVAFLDGKTVLGTAELDATGRATFTTSTLAIGPAKISAVYAGDASYNGSKSSVLNQSVVNAPTVQFSMSSVKVAETAGVVTLTVNRVGSTAGVVSVAFASANGSGAGGAVAPGDYGAVSGTLTWNAGEGGSKTIVVPIVADALKEPDETFTVTLSSAAGATLGSPVTATVTIRKN